MGWCTVLDDEAGSYLKWPHSANVHIFWSRLAVLWICCLKLIWYSAWNNFLWKANDFSYFLFNSLVADVLVTKRNQGIGNQGIDLFCQLAYHFLALQRSLADDEPSVICVWVGIGGFSKVVATFSHVGGSLNLVLATTRDIWVITSFRIWVMYCMLSTFMCHHELWPTSASHPFSFLNSFLSYARLKNGCIVPWQCPFYLSVCPSSFSALKWLWNNA